MTTDNINQATAQRSRRARHCARVGLLTDVVMSVLKVAMGLMGRSSALIADGVHSAGDCFTDGVTLAMMGFSGKGIDSNYRYGRGKFETLTAFIISVVMVLVALELLADGVTHVWQALHGQSLGQPQWYTLAVAVVAVVTKEGLFRYIHRSGKHLDSQALIAYAWHHRADALSSVATLGGIAGAIFLGEPWRVLDPAAAIIVSGFIISLAYRIGRPAVEELLEISLPEGDVARIGEAISEVEGVKAFHNLRTRRNGPLSVIDVHIKVDADMTVASSHNITVQIEQRLCRLLGQTLVNIHVEPYRGQNTCEKHHHAQN